VDLKGAKIAWNATKFGVRICLPKGHRNLCSNFSSQELFKVETPPCVFTRLALKGRENGLECHKSWHAHLSNIGASKSMLEFQFREARSKPKLHHLFSLELGLKWVKIDQNVTKVGVRGFLPMGHQNLF
jgi:hypothetical protein